MAKINKFHPGIYIKDALDSLHMSISDFSLKTEIPTEYLTTLIDGKERITLDIARRLSSYFSNTMQFWTNLQDSYDEYIQKQGLNNSNN